MDESDTTSDDGSGLEQIEWRELRDDGQPSSIALRPSTAGPASSTLDKSLFGRLPAELRLKIYNEVPLRNSKPYSHHYSSGGRREAPVDRSYQEWVAHKDYNSLTRSALALREDFDTLVFETLQLVITIDADQTQVYLEKPGGPVSARIPVATQWRVFVERSKQEEHHKSWHRSVSQLRLAKLKKIVVQPQLKPDIALYKKLASLRQGLKCLDTWLLGSLKSNNVIKPIQLKLHSDQGDNLILALSKDQVSARFPTDEAGCMSWCGLLAVVFEALHRTVEHPIRLVGADTTLHSQIEQSSALHQMEVKHDADGTLLLHGLGTSLANMDDRNHFHIGYAMWFEEAFRSDLSTYQREPWSISKSDWNVWYRWHCFPGKNTTLNREYIKKYAPEKFVDLFLLLHKRLWLAYTIQRSPVDRSRFITEVRRANNGSNGIPASPDGPPVVPAAYKAVLDANIDMTSTLTRLSKAKRHKWSCIGPRP